MRLYSAAAGQAITNAGRWKRSRMLVGRLELHGCDPQEAFAKLAKESQLRNVKLRDIALDLLARLRASP